MPIAAVTPIAASVPSLYMCTDQLDEFGLTTGSVINLRAGTAATEIIVLKSPQGNYISASALEALGVPVKKNLLIRKESDNKLQIGPLIGILTTRRRKNKVPPYTNQNRILHQCLSYCNAQGYIAFVFFPENVDIQENKIIGLYVDTNWDETLVWKKHFFPVPDVVWDRVLHRTAEKSPLVKSIKSFLVSHPSTICFNPKFLDKWETHSILSRNPYLQKHIPLTVNFNNSVKLESFLNQYGTVYVKPIHGSLGKGIFKISVTPDGYCCQYRKGKKTYTEMYKNQEELVTAIKSHKIYGLYVIQQGLELLKYQDRVFDIRVLMQKSEDGQWDFTAIVARVAGGGSIFPNIAAGGEAVNIERVWQNLFSRSWSSSETCRLTKEVSLSAAKTLEHSLGTFCEIGLDIGVDRNGNVWIIEINSKPSRKVFPNDQLTLKNISLKKPMDFAAHLAGFAPKREMKHFEP